MRIRSGICLYLMSPFVGWIRMLEADRNTLNHIVPRDDSHGACLNAHLSA
jgi:hypothetical protein